MQRKHISLTLAAACAALFAGCEWGSTSGSDSWSGSYDAMNFGGTYRISTVAMTSTTTSTTENENSNNNTSQNASESEVRVKQIGKTDEDETNYQGALQANIVPGSVSIVIGQPTTSSSSGVGMSFQDLQQNGTLTPSGIQGTGSVTYQTGTVQIHLSGSFASGLPITAYYRYYKDTTGAAGQGSSSATGGTTTSTTTQLIGLDTNNFDPTQVTAITVSQTGQNLTMSFNNGVVMSGKFTSVRQTAAVSEDTGAGANTYNAQFQVSSGSVSKMVGSLYYDYPTHNRILDGTWTWGKKTFDIHATGPAWTEAGNSTAAETTYGN